MKEMEIKAEIARERAKTMKSCRKYVVKRVPDTGWQRWVRGFVTCEVHQCDPETGETVSSRDLDHVKLHSDLFEAGYLGSGPSDLALSILCDYFGETLGDVSAYGSLAADLAGAFKRDFIADCQLEIGEEYTITASEINHWIFDRRNAER
jgi:hypothetical protein